MDTQLVATQMRHRSWMEAYARQQESGLTVKAWCQENGITQKTFYYRLRVLHEEDLSGFEAIPVEHGLSEEELAERFP